MSKRVTPVFFQCAWALLAACGSSTGAAPSSPSDATEAAAARSDAEPGSEASGKKVGVYRFSTPLAESYKTRVDKSRARRGVADMAANGVEVSPELEPDDRLNEAARTISDMARVGLLVTTPVVQETMWWHGIPESAHGVALFQEADARKLGETIDGWLQKQAQEGYTRFGAVTNEIAGGVRATVIVVKTQVDLLPVPRRIAGPRKLRVEGKADRYYESVSVAVTGPDGASFEPEAKNSSGRFVSTVQLSEKGVWQIEILGDGPTGPTTLANFPVAVGVPVNDEVSFNNFELESRKPGKLERLLFDMINQERRRAGLKSMEWSDDLADVARGYSKEMAKSGLVAHISPVSGSVADRVTAAGIGFATVSENLAKAATVAETHAGLMRSPAHRANIMSKDLERVGIGVEIDDSDNTTNLYVTQVFSRERQPIDPVSTAAEVVEMINRKRVELGRGRIEEHKWLKKEAKRFSKGCLTNNPPQMESFQGIFKSVKAFYVKTSGDKIDLSAIDDLFSREETSLGIHVKEGRDPSAGGEVVCITVLLGRQ